MNYFDQFEYELVAARRRQLSAAGDQRVKRRGRRPSVRVALATVALLAAAVPAAAVTGVFRPHREVDGIVRLSPRVVVASGETPAFGRWQILTSNSSVGECMGLEFLDGPEKGNVGEGCGGGSPGIGSTGGGTDHPDTFLVHGKAVRGAVRVRVQIEDTYTGEAPVIRGPELAPGPWFGVETRGSKRGYCVQMLDAQGRVLAQVDVRGTGACGIPEGADPGVRG